jgi:lysophospholipase L1-like esterase
MNDNKLYNISMSIENTSHNFEKVTGAILAGTLAVGIVTSTELAHADEPVSAEQVSVNGRQDYALGKRPFMVVAGDSIAAGSPDQNWPSYYAERVDKKVINQGHPGQCIVSKGCYYPENLGDRLHQDVLAEQPRYALFSAGINDISRVPAYKMIRQYKRIARTVESDGITPVFATITPLAIEFTTPQTYRDRRNKVNDFIRTQGRKGVWYVVDFAKAVDNKSGDLQHRYASPDYLHVNNEGFKVMAKKLDKLDLEK